MAGVTARLGVGSSYAETVPEPRLMADDLVELHSRCGRRFAELVAGVGPGQWQDGTSCSQWDVRTLVHHLLYEQRWVPPLLDGLTIGQVGDRFEGDLMAAATPRCGRD